MFLSPLYEDMCARDAGAVLAAWLNASPRPFTALLQDIATTPVRIQVLASGERPLTDREQFRLAAPGSTWGRWRNGLLIADGEVAASTILTWLDGRLPEDVRAEFEAGEKPAGAILGPYGMRRTDRRAGATTLIEEVTGQPMAVMSSATLSIGKVPVGIAEEYVTAAFAEALVGGPLPGSTGLQ